MTNNAESVLPDNQSPAIAPATNQPPTITPFKPSWLDRRLGWFVGAHFSPHYTRRDVHNINLGAPVVWLSAGLAAAGITLTLVRYVGVPVDFAPEVALTAAAAYTALDRAIVGSENRDKGHRRLQELTELNTGIQGSRFSRGWRLGKGFWPIAFRVGMALGSSAVTGAALMQLVASNEIDTIITERYDVANHDLFAAASVKKAEYDDHMAAVDAHIKADQKGLEEASRATLAVTGTSPNASQQSVDQRLATIDKQIADQQTSLHTHQAAMAAEAGGASMPGASGVAGQGPKYAAAKIQADQDAAVIADLTRQRETVEKDMAAAAKRDQQAAATAGARTATLAKAGDDIRQDLVQSQAELRALTDGRASEFDKIDQLAVNDPTYRPRQNGTFDRMSALDDYMHSPQTGGITRGYMYSMTVFLFSMELAALLWAVARKPTGSEVRDAWEEKRTDFMAENAIRGELVVALPARAEIWDAVIANSRPTCQPEWRPGVFPVPTPEGQEHFIWNNGFRRATRPRPTPAGRPDGAEPRVGA